MPSRDILDRLFDVEKKAEAIAFSAREEADRRIAAVKEECEAAFKHAYESKVEELQAGLDAAVKKSDVEFKGELAAYRAGLEAAGSDHAAFASLSDGLLFGKA